MNSSKQKAEFIFLGILAILFLILGLKNIENRLRAPFVLKSLEKNVTSNDDAALEALKHKDTDHDGLLDYDEIYLYGTSPYIADSDSDGIPDGQEIKNGTDPNCPQGKVCRADESLNSSSTPLSAPVAPSNSNNIDFSSVVANLGDSQNVTPDVLRSALLDAGMDKQTLDSVDDATLLLLYQQTVNEAKQQTTPQP